MPVGRLETTETGEWLAPIGIASDLTEGCPVVLMPRLMEVRRDPNAQPSRVEDDVAAGLARHGLGQWKEFLADAAAAALIEEHALIALSGELRVAFLKFRVWSAPLRCYYNLLVLVSVSRLGSRTIIDIVIDPEDEPPPSRPYVSGRLGRAGKARSNRQPALVNLSLSESEVAVAVCRFPSQVSSAPRPPAGSHKWTSGRETNEGPAGGRRATDADNGTDPGHDRSSGVGIVHVAEHANDSSAFRHVTPRAVVVVHQAIRLLLGDLVGPLTRPGPAPKLPATCHVDATPETSPRRYHRCQPAPA